MSIREQLRNRTPGTTKLEEHQVRNIKRLLSEGEPIAKLAECYGVSETTVSNIKSGQTWGHVEAGD